jgi:cbb3-type cytochrome oxidase subunit 3
MEEFYFIIISLIFISGIIYVFIEAKKEINLKEKYIKILDEIHDISPEEYDIIKLKILAI